MSRHNGGPKRGFGPIPVGAPEKKIQNVFGHDSDDEENVDINKLKKPRTMTAETPRSSEILTAEAKEVAEKLADFVAKNGRQYEELTRNKNPGDTPFKFLHNKSSLSYKYYLSKLLAFEATQRLTSSLAAGSSSSSQLISKHQPAPSAKKSFDPVAAVDEYAKEMERREKLLKKSTGDDDDDDESEDEARPLAGYTLNETAFDRRKTLAVFKDDGSRGHHMGDYIPKEELTRFLAKTGDAEAAKQAEELAKMNAIKPDNVGFKLLKKMGWKEGEAAGSSKQGITVPIQAVGVQNNVGLGSEANGEVSSKDDIYEQYRKRMMLGYKFRPNPLGNPRKQYY